MSNFSISYTATLRSLYSADRTLGTKAGRADASNSALASADLKALNKGLKTVSKYDFGDDSEDTKAEKTAFYKNLKALMDTYNNSVESTSKSSDAATKKISKKLAKMAKKYEDELSDIGITLDKKGYMKISESAVDNLDVSRFKEVFGEDSEFMKELSKYAKSSSSHIDAYA